MKYGLNPHALSADGLSIEGVSACVTCPGDFRMNAHIT